MGSPYALSLVGVLALAMFLWQRRRERADWTRVLDEANCHIRKLASENSDQISRLERQSHNAREERDALAAKVKRIEIGETALRDLLDAQSAEMDNLRASHRVDAAREVLQRIVFLYNQRFFGNTRFEHEHEWLVAATLSIGRLLFGDARERTLAALTERRLYELAEISEALSWDQISIDGSPQRELEFLG